MNDYSTLDIMLSPHSTRFGYLEPGDRFRFPSSDIVCVKTKSGYRMPGYCGNRVCTTGKLVAVIRLADDYQRPGDDWMLSAAMSGPAGDVLAGRCRLCFRSNGRQAWYETSVANQRNVIESTGTASPTLGDYRKICSRFDLDACQSWFYPPIQQQSA